MTVPIDSAYFRGGRVDAGIGFDRLASMEVSA